jgi:hypothetical protein
LTGTSLEDVSMDAGPTAVAAVFGAVSILL